MSADNYKLTLYKQSTEATIRIKANSSAHAQGQALDIVRAVAADRYDLDYGSEKAHSISDIFENLAFNNFKTKDCIIWEGPYVNTNPCEYLLNNRFYIRKLISRYLDIPTDNVIVKTRCKDKRCINPYHFEYHTSKNSKLTCGDLKLLVAYQGQGASVSQIAKAFNVHPSTIYRTLNRERLHSGTSD